MSDHRLPVALRTALKRIFTPLVRLLLRNGVAYGWCADILKEVYVEVAERTLPIPGKKQTVARVATLTGLTRKEVQRIKKLGETQAEYGDDRYNRAARVISAWVRDGAFHDANGAPAPLPFEGNGASFSELVKRHSGDIPPRAILDELLRVRSVEADSDGQLRLRVPAYVPSDDDAETVAILGTDVCDLIATITHNLQPNGAPRRFQRKVCYNNLPEESVDALREEIVAVGQTALEAMDRVLSESDRDSNPTVAGHGRVRAGIGIYYFEESIEQGHKQA